MDKKSTSKKIPSRYVLLGTTIALIIVSVSLFLINRSQRLQVVDLINRGKVAESEFRFDQAARHFQAALDLDSPDSSVRYQLLCRLAIVSARNHDSQKAQELVEEINSNYPAKENFNAKIELAVLAASQEVDFAAFERGQKLSKKLNQVDDISLDDQNNFLALSIRYYLSSKYNVYEHFTTGFKQILESDPDHLEANYNLFRIARNQNRVPNSEEKKYLAKCAAINGDEPHWLYMKFRHAANELNQGVIAKEDYLKLIEDYAQKGGDRERAKNAIGRIADPKHLAFLRKEFENIDFESRNSDSFVFLGVSNPINLIEF